LLLRQHQEQQSVLNATQVVHFQKYSHYVPHDVMLHILQYLNYYPYQISVSRTCKAIRAIALETLFPTVKVLDLIPKHESDDETTADMATTAPAIKYYKKFGHHSSHLTSQGEIRTQVYAWLCKLIPNVTHLKMAVSPNLSYSCNFLKGFYKYLPGITHIDLVFHDGFAVEALYLCSPVLQKLSLYNYSAEKYPFLREAEVDAISGEEMKKKASKRVNKQQQGARQNLYSDNVSFKQQYTIEYQYCKNRACTQSLNKDKLESWFEYLNYFKSM